MGIDDDPLMLEDELSIKIRQCCEKQAKVQNMLGMTIKILVKAVWKFLKQRHHLTF